MSKRIRVQYKSDLPSKTIQSDKAMTDVNNILDRYKQTGHISFVNRNPAQYGDFTSISDFRQSLETVSQAYDNFALLPAHLRKFFNNDPTNVIDFLSNPQNQEKAIELGLLKPIPQTQVTDQNQQSSNDDKTTKNAAKSKSATKSEE